MTSKNEIKLERWEADEFIIDINGKPIGSTISEDNGKIVLRWLELSGLKEALSLASEKGNIDDRLRVYNLACKRKEDNWNEVEEYYKKQIQSLKKQTELKDIEIKDHLDDTETLQKYIDKLKAEKSIPLGAQEIMEKIEKMKMDDEFHEWYRGILGEDDILIKIIDKLKGVIQRG